MDFDLAGNGFFRHPHTGAIFGGGYCMLGVGLAGIIEVCNILITPTIYLLLNIFMLTLGALMLFFSGRVGNVSEFCYVGNNGVGFAVIP